MGTLALVVTLLAADGGTQETNLEMAMKANLAQVASLLPFLSDPDAFRDPKNSAAISASIKVLSGVKHASAARDNSAIHTIGTMYEQEVERARFDFDQRNADSARHRLIGLTRMCIGCHTRAAARVDWTGMDGLVDSLKLTNLQRANFYVGTHQFDRAKAVWTKALAEVPANDSTNFDQAQSLRLAVATLTRAEHDPDAVIALLKPQLKRKDFPGFIQRSMKRWYADANAWKAEKYNPEGQPPERLLTRAEALLASTGAATLLLTDDDGLVRNMRAAHYAQRALDAAPSTAMEARALYALALAHTSSNEASLWQLDALYLERCVYLQPHTPQAERCVERLADRVGFAFHGSMGGRPPDGLINRLGVLRSLAVP